MRLTLNTVSVSVLVLTMLVVIVSSVAVADTSPPTVYSASLVPPYVGTSRTLYITASVRDDVGVADVSAAIQPIADPSVSVGTATLALYYGTAQDGNWSAIFVFPESAADGAYGVSIAARDGAGNVATFPAGSITLDRTPPDTRITSAVDGSGNVVAEGGRSKSKSISFFFEGSDASGISGFLCALDGGFYDWCRSGITYTDLRPGMHAFTVKSVDLAANQDPTPAMFAWSVKRPPTA